MSEDHLEWELRRQGAIALNLKTSFPEETKRKCALFVVGRMDELGADKTEMIEVLEMLGLKNVERIADADNLKAKRARSGTRRSQSIGATGESTSG